MLPDGGTRAGSQSCVWISKPSLDFLLRKMRSPGQTGRRVMGSFRPGCLFFSLILRPPRLHLLHLAECECPEGIFWKLKRCQPAQPQPGGEAGRPSSCGQEGRSGLPGPETSGKWHPGEHGVRICSGCSPCFLFLPLTAVLVFSGFPAC